EDTTPPIFGEDTTTAEGTTGEPVTFRVNVTDDVAVQNVSVDYWVYGTLYYGTGTMDSDGDIYSFTLTLPDDIVGTVSYWFHSLDTSGNNATSEEGGIIVEDNDPPRGTVDLGLPATVETGESYQVSVSVEDNVAVWSVTVIMYLDTGADEPLYRSQSLQGFGTFFSGTVIMGTNSVGTLTHHMIIRDMYDNDFISPESVSELVDTIPPDMEFLVPLTTKVGETLFLEVKATDNIGIVDVRWKGLPFEPEGFFANGSFDEPGEYTVTVTVVDAAGNEDSNEVKVFVEDDVSATTVMVQVAVMLVLILVVLVLVKWLMDKRARERGRDPELEDSPMNELPERLDR
ncbi:MAG: hypothetical protein KAJ35_04905, partial [Thermoplasmata archaeon]|nr:hypothetical protein [Thermoplasmata archaeon]